HKEKTRSVKGFPGSKEISTTDPLTIDCDILVPAALENQITKENADKIKAKLMVELANGPTTPEADKILQEKGVIVLPDVLASAGGVTVSYFEWVQNRMGYYWTEEEVDDKLKRVMTTAFKEVYQTAKQYCLDTSFRVHTKAHQLNLRTATYILAVKRIYEAMKALGRI
ncbi:glutamate dehydrogenase, partial [Candidatus Bathyarchaeota archaeon]|nr:glutamate dehydrogenase [Candidatus Bathyarchaeota archaeon]